MVSAMMNSHIASFLVGIENGVPAVRLAACPSIVKSAWLTVPPPCLGGLELHPQQPHQVHPKDIHKMPIACGRIHRAPPQDRPAEFMYDEDDPDQASEHMQGV